MGKKLIVFDVDGVLLDNERGGFKDILIVLGKDREVQRIDEEYQRRKHLGPWGLEELSKLYQGFSENELKRKVFNYCQQNLMEGAKAVLNKLKKKGYIVGALSSNPQFIMDALAQILALDFSEGTRLEFKGSGATGKIQKKVDRYGKAEILQEKMENYQIKKENLIVVGDSITDLPAAELAGVFIAFRPKDNIVKERANKIVENFQQLKKLL